MKVHLIVEQDDGTLFGLSSEAALVEIERTAEMDEFTYGHAAYARPINHRTTLTLELLRYTMFRPSTRPWPRQELETVRAVSPGQVAPIREITQ